MADDNETTHIHSGSTSPTDSPAPSVSGESEETEVSTNGTTDSDPSIVYPRAPANTPATLSLAGDTVLNASSDSGAAPPDATFAQNLVSDLMSVILEQDSQTPTLVNTSPTNSVAEVPETNEGETPIVASTPTATEETAHFPEYTTWTCIAKEDLAHGLQRLARAAKDLHKIDESVSVEQYYGQHLAEVLKAAEIKFDAQYLQ